MRYLVIPCIILLLALAGCASPRPGPTSTVTVHVIPDSLPPGSAIHMTGNISELGLWQPDAVHLTPNAGGVWSFRFHAPRDSVIEFKFTRGTWRSEAVNAMGQEMENFRLRVGGDTIVQYRLHAWRDRVRTVPVISVERMEHKGGQIELIERWRFQAGDDVRWADAGFDDQTWREIDPSLPADSGTPPGWTGNGWFRLTVRVDSSLWGRPLALFFRQGGASEVFLNGRPIFALGTVAAPGHPEETYEDRYPRIISFDRLPVQVLAVRYSNHQLGLLHRFHSDAGFFATIVPPDLGIQLSGTSIRTDVAFQVAFNVVAIGLAVLYLLLYFFDRSQKAALMLALLIGGIGFVGMMNYITLVAATNRVTAVLSQVAAGLIIPYLGVFGLLTGVFMTGSAPRRYLWLYVLVATGGAVWSGYTRGPVMNIALFMTVVIPSIEWIWMVLRNATKRSLSAPVVYNPWIVGSGAVVFVAGVIYQFLFTAGWVSYPLPVTPYYLGFVVFAVSLSVQIANVTARNARELRHQLRQVSELSEKTLVQERRAHEQELSRRIIEADNERKTRELDDARSVQLSMLPRVIPSPRHYALAVRMSTASEVGGDYYDFRLLPDGSVVAAIGDATGHGMKAGIMVAAMKSLFNAAQYGSQFPEFPKFFEQSTCVFRQMHLGNLFMSLTMVRLDDGSVTLASAGMPPALLYRAGAGCVENLVIKGMPLGAHEGYPYNERTFSLGQGDTLLIMTDGLTELFNDANDQLEIERVCECFASHASEPPERILDALECLAAHWRGVRPQADDMTMMVIRRT